MGHAITFTLPEGGGPLRSQVVCTEPPEADCHLTSECGCETIGSIETDELGKYHLARSEGYDLGMPIPTEREVKHRMEPLPGSCNIVDWLENDDALDENGLADVSFTVPIEPVWEGDYYQWKPLQEGTTP